MSLPSYKIACTGCVYGGRYSYNVWYEYDKGRDALVQPDLAQGWCRDCERILTIYVPRASEQMHEDADNASALISSEAKKQKGWWSWLLRTKRNEKAIERWTEAISRYNESACYFKKHNLKMRCLTCGSENVEEVLLPDDPDVLGLTGVKHACGGEITAMMFARIAFGKRPRVIYDISGNIVHDERTIGPVTASFGLELIRNATINVVLENGNYAAFVIRVAADTTLLVEDIKQPATRAALIAGVEKRISLREYVDPSEEIGMVREARQMTGWKPNMSAIRVVIGLTGKQLLSWSPTDIV